MLFFDKVKMFQLKAVSMGIKNILNAKSIIPLYGGVKAEAIAGTVSGSVTEVYQPSSLQKPPWHDDYRR